MINWSTAFGMSFQMSASKAQIPGAPPLNSKVFRVARTFSVDKEILDVLDDVLNHQ
jgi:hypothetical protein